MSKELKDATKKEMGYNDMAPLCSNCKFHTEAEEYSRSWVDMCNFSNLISFSVNKYGSCKQFIDKNTIKRSCQR